MGRKNKKRFISYHLSTFIKEKVQGLTPAQYDMLDETDRDLIKKIGYASLEEKLWILGKIGYRFAITVMDRKKIIESRDFSGRIYKMISLLKRKLSLSVGSTLSDYGFFVLADNHIMKALTAISSILNNKTYYVIRKYEDIVENIDRVEDVEADSESSRQAKKTIDLFTLNILMGSDTISKLQKQTTHTITIIQFSILLYLSIYDDSLKCLEDIVSFFNGNSHSVKSNLKKLKSMGYVDMLNRFRRVAHVQDEKLFYSKNK